MSFSIKPVVDKDFINRKEELSELLSTLKDTESVIGFALYGKRRVGKTSLLKEAKRRLEKESQTVPIYFSMWDLTEKRVADFAKEFTVKTLDAFKPKLGLKHKTVELLELPFNLLVQVIRELKISIKIRDDITFLLSSDEKKAPPAALIEEAFGLPEQLAKETKTKCILLIDEFPDIIELKSNGHKIGEQIIKKVRTINEDYKHSVLCISGSIKKTMELAAFSRNSAFYGQFVAKEIKPLQKEHVATILKNNLSAEITSEAISKLFEFTGGMPFYVQFIGRILSQKQFKKISAQEIETGTSEFLEEEGDILFTEEIEKLSDSEKEAAITIAVKQCHSPSKIAKETKKELTTTATTLRYLEQKGVITKKEKAQYFLEDPVFEKWLAKKYGKNNSTWA